MAAEACIISTHPILIVSKDNYPTNVPMMYRACEPWWRAQIECPSIVHIIGMHIACLLCDPH